jgi:hypothetical protein
MQYPASNWHCSSCVEDARSNKSIDTDVLAAGFACLWPAGHFRR